MSISSSGLVKLIMYFKSVLKLDDFGPRSDTPTYVSVLFLDS